MKKARLIESVENEVPRQTAIDTTTQDPYAIFHADLAAEFVDVPDQVSDGWYLQGGEWQEPPPAPVLPKAKFGKVITTLAFRNRFTNEEAIKIDLAGQGNTQTAAGMRQYQKKVDSATYIQLDRPELLTDLQTLQAATLLAEGRPEAIIGEDVGSLELPVDVRLYYGLTAIPTPAELAIGGRGWLSPDDVSA